MFLSGIWLYTQPIFAFQALTLLMLTPFVSRVEDHKDLFNLSNKKGILLTLVIRLIQIVMVFANGLASCARKEIHLIEDEMQQ